MNEYYEYFGPDYELDVKSSNTDDLNTPAYLDRVKRIVMENLRHTGGPPSVQMSGKYYVVRCHLANLRVLHIDIPSLPIDMELDDPTRDEDLIPPDTRRHRRLLDSRRQADGELSDSDDEGEGGRTNHADHRDADSTLTEAAGGRKFGIMTSASTTAGAGPSGRSTAAHILSGGATTMEVDDADGTPPAASSTENENESNGDEKTANGVHQTEDDMAVDTPDS